MGQLFRLKKKNYFFNKMKLLISAVFAVAAARELDLDNAIERLDLIEEKFEDLLDLIPESTRDSAECSMSLEAHSTTRTASQRTLLTMNLTKSKSSPTATCVH